MRILILTSFLLSSVALHAAGVPTPIPDEIPRVIPKGEMDRKYYMDIWVRGAVNGIFLFPRAVMKSLGASEGLLRAGGFDLVGLPKNEITQELQRVLAKFPASQIYKKGELGYVTLESLQWMQNAVSPQAVLNALNSKLAEIFGPLASSVAPDKAPAKTTVPVISAAAPAKNPVLTVTPEVPVAGPVSRPSAPSVTSDMAPEIVPEGEKESKYYLFINGRTEGKFYLPKALLRALGVPEKLLRQEVTIGSAFESDHRDMAELAPFLAKLTTSQVYTRDINSKFKSLATREGAEAAPKKLAGLRDLFGIKGEIPSQAPAGAGASLAGAGVMPVKTLTPAIAPAQSAASGEPRQGDIVKMGGETYTFNGKYWSNGSGQSLDNFAFQQLLAVTQSAASAPASEPKKEPVVVSKPSFAAPKPSAAASRPSVVAPQKPVVISKPSGSPSGAPAQSAASGEPRQGDKAKMGGETYTFNGKYWSNGGGANLVNDDFQQLFAITPGAVYVPAAEPKKEAAVVSQPAVAASKPSAAASRPSVVARQKPVVISKPSESPSGAPAQPAASGEPRQGDKVKMGGETYTYRGQNWHNGSGQSLDNFTFQQLLAVTQSAVSTPAPAPRQEAAVVTKPSESPSGAPAQPAALEKPTPGKKVQGADGRSYTYNARGFWIRDDGEMVDSLPTR